MPDNPPVLLLAHHRSGSNFVHDLIQSHLSTESISEPFSMHTECFREWDLRPWFASDYDEQVYHPDLAARPGAVIFLRHLRAYLMGASRGQLRAFKETTLFEKLPWLERYLPGIRVILLVRDPRAVAFSIVRRNMHEFFEYRKVLRPWQETLRTEVSRLSPCGLVAHSWRLRIQLAMRHLASRAHAVMRLEDLIERPSEAMERLMAFLGLKPDEGQSRFLEYANAVTAGGQYSTRRRYEDVVDLWRAKLSADGVKEVEEIAHDEMVSFGYVPTGGR